MRDEHATGGRRQVGLCRSARSRLRLAVSCIAIAAVAAGCGGQAGPAGGERPLELGAILPETGDLAAFGPPTRRAVELAVRQANDNGGVHGQDVSLTVKDEGGSAEVTRSAADALRRDRVAAIIGAFGSSSSLTIIDTLTQSEIVMISPSNGGEEFTDYPDDGYYFRTVPASSNEGRFGADHAIERGLRSVAILAMDDSYGQAYADAFERQLEAKGGEVTVRINFDAKSTSFDAEVRKVARTDPQAVMMAAFSDSGALIARTAFEHRLLERPWIVTDGIKDPDFPSSVFPGKEDRFRSWEGTGAGGPRGGAAEAFAAAYERAYGEPPGPFGANAYDAAWLAILAAEAGDGSGRSIKDQLAEVSGSGGQKCSAAECLDAVHEGKDIDYVGASGEIDFDSAGNLTTAYYLIWRFDAEHGTRNTELVERDLE